MCPWQYPPWYVVVTKPRSAWFCACYVGGEGERERERERELESCANMESAVLTWPFTDSVQEDCGQGENLRRAPSATFQAFDCTRSPKHMPTPSSGWTDYDRCTREHVRESAEACCAAV